MTLSKKRCSTCGLEVEPTINVCPADGSTIDDPFQDDPIFQGKYEFLESIGAGGMGVIYKARHVILNKIIAIKMVHSHLVSPQAIQRFQVEGKAASSLSHPYIIAVHDFSTTSSGQPYMVMDYLTGLSLSQVLAKVGQLDSKRFLRIFLQATDALAYAHSRGVVHRDIKPANIMLVTGAHGEEEVRIMDFGLAKIVDDTEQAAKHLTKTGVAMGSPYYMSPEQSRGTKVDHRSDLYSLGCTMYEALTGSPPFEGNTPFETMLMHLKNAPAPLKEASLGKDFDPRLQKIIDPLLEKSLEFRYQSMDDLHADLLALQNDDAALPPEPQTRKNNTLKVVLVSVAAVSALALAAAAGIKMLAPHPVASVVKAPAQAAPPLAKPPLAQTAPEEAKSQAPPTSTTAPQANLGSKSGPTPNGAVLNLGQSILNEKAKDFIAKKVRDNNASDSLDLSGANFASPKDDDLEPVSKAFNAKILSLKSLPITDKGLRYILPLKLTSLNLESTDVSDLPGLESMSSLQHLYLSQTNLSSKGLSAIGLLKNLEGLDLSASSVSDAELPSLYKLHKLTSLSLSGCRNVTPGAVERLRDNFKGSANILFERNDVLAQDEAHDHLKNGIDKFSAGKWDAAYADFSDVVHTLKDAPESPLRIECLWRAGDCKFELRQFSLASIRYREAIQVAEKTQEGSLDLFRLYNKQANALEMSSNQPQEYNWQSNLHDAIDSRLKADHIFSLNHQYARPDDRAMEMTNLFSASFDYAKLHKPHDAARMFSKATSNTTAPDSEVCAESALSISICYIQLNDFAGALPFLERSLKYFSSHSAGHMEKKDLLEHGLADCYYRLGRYKDAESLLKTVTARPITDATLTKRNYDTLIQVLQKEKKPDEVALYTRRLQKLFGPAL